MARPGLVKDDADLRALGPDALTERGRAVDEVGADGRADFGEGRLLALALQDDDIPLTLVDRRQALGLDGEVLLERLPTGRLRFDHRDFPAGAFHDFGEDIGELVDGGVAIADEEHALGVSGQDRGQRSQQQAKPGEGAIHSPNPRLPHGESTPALASVRVVTSVSPCVA